MKLLPVCALLLMVSSALRAETALSVDFNSLWRVDLSSHQALQLSSFGDPAPFLSCKGLTRSTLGRLLCLRHDGLFEVLGDSLEFVSTLRGSSNVAGLAFDDLDRLWFVTRNDPVLWQLDPDTGSILEATPLSLDGSYHYALAAHGQQLFAFTRTYPAPLLLEEVDTSTGASLSAMDVGSLGFFLPLDAAFSEGGDLWIANGRGGFNCYSYDRLSFEPLALEQTWYGCIHVYEQPIFANIAAVEPSPIVNIPTVSGFGLIALVLAILLSALGIFRVRKSDHSSSTGAAGSATLRSSP